MITRRQFLQTLSAAVVTIRYGVPLKTDGTPERRPTAHMEDQCKQLVAKLEAMLARHRWEIQYVEVIPYSTEFSPLCLARVRVGNPRTGRAVVTAAKFYPAILARPQWGRVMDDMVTHFETELVKYMGAG